MIDVIHTQISKSQLKALNKRDLAVFLGSTKLFGEVNISSKHLLIALHNLTRDASDPGRSTGFSFYSYALRMLAGHLHETSRFVEAHVHAKDFAESKATIFNKRLAPEIKSFKAYFSKPNAVTDIRRKLSFHTDLDVLLQAFEIVDDAFNFDIFLGNPTKHDVSQFLFAGADVITYGSIYYLPSVLDLTKGKGVIGTYILELLGLAQNALNILALVAVYTWDTRLGLQAQDGKKITAELASDYSNIVLPYFLQLEASLPTAGSDSAL